MISPVISILVSHGISAISKSITGKTLRLNLHTVQLASLEVVYLQSAYFSSRNGLTLTFETLLC